MSHRFIQYFNHNIKLQYNIFFHRIPLQHTRGPNSTMKCENPKLSFIYYYKMVWEYKKKTESNYNMLN